MTKKFRTAEKTLARAKILRRDMTDAEKKLWRHLRDRQIDDHFFRKQVPIGIYIADFCCLRARLVVEVDGGQHDESAADARRSAWLLSQGYRVLRFWNNEITSNIDGVVATIAEALRNQPPPNPPPEGGGL
jgi:very-short-patch-repair endonuclease